MCFSLLYSLGFGLNLLLANQAAPGSDVLYFTPLPPTCVQPEQHPELPAQTETDGPVLSHPDSGAGEAGEGRPQEPRPHHRQREGSGCLGHPEDPGPPLQLLHCE